MPRYDYECEDCKEKEERTVIFWEELQFCKRCGGLMERLFSPQGTTFQVRWGQPKVRRKVKRMGA